MIMIKMFIFVETSVILIIINNYFKYTCDHNVRKFFIVDLVCFLIYLLPKNFIEFCKLSVLCLYHRFEWSPRRQRSESKNKYIYFSMFKDK